MVDWLFTEVTEIERVAEDVVSIALAADEALPAWEPGAHIDVMLPGDLERQYSLCGDQDDPRWRIAVLREPESRGGSAAIHELSPGARLRVRGPRNNFALEPADDYLFIAGGIGITPLLPMIRRLDVPWQLLYGGRRRASMAYAEELMAAHGDRVTLWPQDTHGLLDLDAWLGRPRSGTAVYCCGPEPLIAAVEERCATWPPDALHVERFRPRAGAGDVRADGPFDVVLARSGATVTVGEGQSILDALEDAGMFVEFSCREGVCGTCATVVLDGLPDHRDSFLDEAERTSNQTMMLCCSRALTPSLVLDA